MFRTILFLIPILASSISFASFGINFGAGFPYTTQYGINYMPPSKSFSFELLYNSLSISAGLAKVSLTKPELQVKWHPFEGSFFLGLGLGQSTLSATGTDETTGLTTVVTVKSTAMTPTLGWMWGAGDGGLFFGMDVGFQSPSGATTTIESLLPASSQAYLDAVEQGNKLGNTGFPVITFFRLGYIF